MSNDKIKIQIGDKIPDEISNGKITGIIITWIHDDMHVFISDCQSSQEATIFSSSKIKLSVSRIDSAIFFLFAIPALGIYMDIPYNVNLTPLTMEEIEKGFSRLCFYFCDRTGIVKSIRGIEFSKHTKQNIASLFVEQRNNYIASFNDYYRHIDEIFLTYPTFEDLKKKTILDINWRDKFEFS